MPEQCCRAHDSDVRSPTRSCHPGNLDPGPGLRQVKATSLAVLDIESEQIAYGVLGFLCGIGSGVHRQPWHVCSDGAAVFSLEDDRVPRCHSNPASFSMRRASRPTSFLVWTDTQTSFFVTGCTNLRWASLADPFLDETRGPEATDQFGPRHSRTV